MDLTGVPTVSFASTAFTGELFNTMNIDERFVKIVTDETDEMFNKGKCVRDLNTSDGITFCCTTRMNYFFRQNGRYAKYIWDVQIPDHALIKQYRAYYTSNEVILSNKRSIWDDEDYCLAAVKEYGMLLKHVNVQTPEMCMIAVKMEPRSLQYVKEQTE